MGYYVGIDIGGSFIKYGLLDETGKLVDTGKHQTTAAGKAIKQKIKEIVTEYSQKNVLAGVGISMPGVVRRDGYLISSGAIEDMRGTHLKKELESLLGLPVKIENDANTIALAEKWLGAARDYRNFVCMPLGTAVGGAVFINNQLYHGAHGVAGEFGVSLVGLSSDHIADCMSFHAGVVAGLCRSYSQQKGERVLDASEVYKRSKAGDEIARECVAHFYKAVVTCLVNISVSIDPEAIFIGGGISENQEMMHDIRTQFAQMRKEYKILSIFEMPEIKTCQLGNNAGLVGAVCALVEEQEKEKAREKQRKEEQR